MKDLFGQEEKKEPIRTLGLYQPFATLMLYGKIETRFISGNKKPGFKPGKYLLYSCQKAYDFFDALNMMGDEADLAEEHFEKEYQRLFSTIDAKTKGFLQGYAICLADLTKIIDPITPDIKNTFVEYVAPCSRRRVGLVFENVQRLKPFEFKGKQGPGFLDEKYLSQIELI